jgi:peptidyl-Lys metalloendopeptidase
MATLLVLPFSYAQEPSDLPIITLKMDKAEYWAVETQTLVFNLKNPTNQDITILKWFTPLDGMNGDIFRVEMDGEPIEYRGRKVKRGPFIPEDFVTIKPGEYLEVNVDLAQNYDIREVGYYTVAYKDILLKNGLRKPLLTAMESSMDFKGPISNVAEFTLLERKIPEAMAPSEKTEDEVQMKTLSGFNGCSNEQEIHLIYVLQRAEEIAQNAKIALTGTLETQRSDATRYTEWFGAYDIDRYTTVTENFTTILDALANKTIKFDCSCDENFYAYVYSNQPYTIYLCNAFWNASILGTDSQAGTLVHETSHFKVVADTDDHEYGQSNCRNLANNDPAKAIENADSHEYFAENTPVLGMGDAASMVASLMASNGNYVVAEGGGGGAVNANRVEARTWETFILIDRNGGYLMSGDSVNLGTYDGKHFLVAEGGGGREVKADRTGARAWETFTIRKVSGSGRIRFGDEVSIQVYNGQYMVAEGGGGGVVNANRDAVGRWEKFRLYSPSLSHSVLVHLQARDGNYVVAEKGGGGAVNANRAAARQWETFTLIDKNGGNLMNGDLVNLRTFDGTHFLVAEGGGGREVKADRTWARTWETFTINRVTGNGEITDGDEISLQAYNGQYVDAEGGGGGVVNANRDAVGSWEKFMIEFVD